MALVSIVAAVTSIDVPATNAAAGQFQASLRAADGSLINSQNSDTPNFSFTGVPPGEHTANVVRLDVAGGVIGSPVSAPVSVPVPAVPPAPAPAPTVAVDVPSGLTVTVTAE